MWTQLSTIFSDLNAKRDAANRLHSNFQLNRPFLSWIAEIRCDATIVGYNTDSIQIPDLVFFNMSVDSKKALVHERDIDDPNFDEAVSRLQDIENR
ncbi:hypothetical protein K3495_g4345 [Podosphaera aphanis]|nr:hypothetical protein K3495_g4345 [Podosphaera aphanis]